MEKQFRETITIAIIGDLFLVVIIVFNFLNMI